MKWTKMTTVLFRNEILIITHNFHRLPADSGAVGFISCPTLSSSSVHCAETD